MYHLLDILLSLVHISWIGFNLLGWMWKKTRKWNLITICLTAFSWFVLGIWFGLGYCPVTDWQWDVKGKLGETNLPGSFIKYFLDNLLSIDLSPEFVDILTGGAFALAAGLSIYYNLKK